MLFAKSMAICLSWTFCYCVCFGSALKMRAVRLDLFCFLGERFCEQSEGLGTGDADAERLPGRESAL